MENLQQYSYAELTQFLLVIYEEMDRQFYFWISITFAVIVAAFVADDRFTRRLRYLVSGLYLAATFVLVSRYVNSAVDVSAINIFLREAEANVRIMLLGRVTPLVRVLLWVAGTGSAVYFLLRPQGKR